MDIASGGASEGIQLLLEEWKQNVALYIDQDKRGLERIKMFLTIHAGLLVLFSAIWRDKPNIVLVGVGWVVVLFAVIFTVVTRQMSKRAHAFILLRKTQGMLIEKKIAGLLAQAAGGNQAGFLQTSAGAINTFSREHVAFMEDSEAKKCGLLELRNEIANFSSYAMSPFEGKGFWKRSWGHLRWLLWVFAIICILWVALGAALTIVWLLPQ